MQGDGKERHENHAWREMGRAKGAKKLMKEKIWICTETFTQYNLFSLKLN